MQMNRVHKLNCGKELFKGCVKLEIMEMLIFKNESFNFMPSTSDTLQMNSDKKRLE